MYATVKIISVFALAGSVLALPAADIWVEGRKRGSREVQSIVSSASAELWTNRAATATVCMTNRTPAPTGGPPVTSVPSPASTETPLGAAGGQFYNQPSASGRSSVPAAAASSATPPAPSTGVDGSWEGIVSEWRTRMGLKALSDDSQLIQNAQKTADESVGGLLHQLNPGSMAQVLAPGDTDNFEYVFVGGWLCELPNTTGLNGVCAQQSEGWSYEGQTGHAEILTSPSYSKIGCAYSSGTGVWSCDLA